MTRPSRVSALNQARNRHCDTSPQQQQQQQQHALFIERLLLYDVTTLLPRYLTVKRCELTEHLFEEMKQPKEVVQLYNLHLITHDGLMKRFLLFGHHSDHFF